MSQSGQKGKSHRHQKLYFYYWIILLGWGELALFVFARRQSLILILISAGFFVGFILRLLRLYPGKREPLVVDLSTCLLALLLSTYITGFNPPNAIALILLPFITIPHIFYIISRKVW